MFTQPTGPSTGAKPYDELVSDLARLVAQNKAIIQHTNALFAANQAGGQPIGFRNIPYMPYRILGQGAELPVAPTQSLQEIFNRLGEEVEHAISKTSDHPPSKRARLADPHLGEGLPPLHSHEGAIIRLNHPEDTFFGSVSLLESSNLLDD